MDDAADHLPEIYRSFRRRFPEAVQQHDADAASVDAAGPLAAQDRA